MRWNSYRHLRAETGWRLVIQLVGFLVMTYDIESPADWRSLANSAELYTRVSIRCTPGSLPKFLTSSGYLSYRYSGRCILELGCNDMEWRDDHGQYNWSFLVQEVRAPTLPMSYYGALADLRSPTIGSGFQVKSKNTIETTGEGSSSCSFQYVALTY